MSGCSLRFDGLARAFGRLEVLRGVSGAVETGQVLLVTGPNGCGKSTLLKCLAGLLRPQAGWIRYREDGEELDVGQRRRSLGYLGPDLALYEPLTAFENLEFFARLRGVSPNGGGVLLECLGLPPDRLTGALSSGMRQRLRWAWALLHRPRLLLLDEPFDNLDRPGEEAARALLDEHLLRGLAVVATPTSLELPNVASRIHLDL